MATKKKTTIDKPYKTIKDNPEVFEAGQALVTDIKENPDGSSTLVLDFTREQLDLILDVSLRKAIVEGLKATDAESTNYANILNVVVCAKEFAKLATKWEQSDSFDWRPKASKSLAKLNEALAKIERS